jgi:hypothetical protein
LESKDVEKTVFVLLKEDESESWWIYTLRRIGRHLTPPEMPRTLSAYEEFQKNPVPPRKSGDKKSKPPTLDEVLDEPRKRDLAFYEARIARIERLIALIKDIKEGAFGGFADNPIVRGILIPSVGLGSLQLIQRLLLG